MRLVRRNFRANAIAVPIFEIRIALCREDGAYLRRPRHGGQRTGDKINARSSQCLEITTTSAAQTTQVQRAAWVPRVARLPAGAGPGGNGKVGSDAHNQAETRALRARRSSVGVLHSSSRYPT